MANSKKLDGLSEIHKLLGMTPAEVRQELIDRGYDPEEEVAKMRRLGRVLAAKFGDQIEREARMPREAAKSFPIFEEAVAAGHPIWADRSEACGEASLFDLLSDAPPEHTMWARVSGWSMRDAAVRDGDLVLVNTRAEPKDGDIVLAHLAGLGQVVKRLRLRDGRVALESANPDFEPIEVEDPATLRIHGVVIGRAGTV